MSFEEGADYNPVDIEKYILQNMQFFKRWALNNITLNQLNSILIEQQMMPDVFERKVDAEEDASLAAYSMIDSSVYSVIVLDGNEWRFTGAIGYSTVRDIYKKA